MSTKVTLWSFTFNNNLCFGTVCFIIDDKKRIDPLFNAAGDARNHRERDRSGLGKKVTEKAPLLTARRHIANGVLFSSLAAALHVRV